MEESRSILFGLLIPSSDELFQNPFLLQALQSLLLTDLHSLIQIYLVRSSVVVFFGVKLV